MMTNWELSLDWALAIARENFLVGPGSTYGRLYVDWVFARHPDLAPLAEEM